MSKSPLERARAAMRATGQWHGAQAMGRRWAIGCIALEVTQRCNLDCGLCYLSESAEAVKDVPLAELYRRIDEIREIYGANTDVQVTGGEEPQRQFLPALADDLGHPARPARDLERRVAVQDLVEEDGRLYPHHRGGDAGVDPEPEGHVRHVRAARDVKRQL